MTRTPGTVSRLALLAAFVLAMCSLAGTAAAAEADDNVPGVAVTASPISTHLDSESDPDEVRSIWLEAGDTLYLTLYRTGTPSAAFWPNLYLYDPATTDIFLFSPIRYVEGTFLPKSITFTAPAAALYYINMHAPDTDTPESGDVALYWSVLRPVFRFFNMKNGTHFYTPNTAERDTVLVNWPHILRYEGVAYNINPYNNTQPLYRFFNPRTGSHFYTASPEERDHVIRTWPTVLRYEGETYSVNRAQVPNSITVYRFYQMRTGGHFYTADAAERDTVIRNWPTVYRYEGPAFYLGQ